MTVTATEARPSSRAWGVLLLCGFAGMLFYIDRQTLSVLKTTLASELGWSDADYGWLVSAFMASYTLCYLVSGRWIDRWGARRAMPVFIGVMSLATLLCGVANSLGAMIAFRALLGVAEAGIVPAVFVSIVAWFPATQRGTASTLKEPINIAGQIIATPLAAALALGWGWRTAFFVPGAFGLLVAATWWWLCRGRDEPSATTAAPRESYLSTLRRREIRGVIAARMVSDPLWFFLMYWEPAFLQDKLGLSLAQLGRIGWIPTAVATIALIGLGALSDQVITRCGWTPARSRRTALQALACLAPAVFFLPWVASPTGAIALLCVVRVMMIVWLNFSNLLLADLVPSHVAGTALALMSGLGAAMGLLCNAFVGSLVGTVGYGALFWVGACLHPLAAIILWRYYGREENIARRPHFLLAPGSLR